MKLDRKFDHSLLPEIEKSKYLRTHEILPVVGKVLEIQFGEGELVNRNVDVYGLKGDKVIELTTNSKLYSITFFGLIAYSVRDELYAVHPENEECIGTKVCLYSASNFLDFVGSSTWALDGFAEELLHFQVNTLDHTIDIATTEPAELKLLK